MARPAAQTENVRVHGSHIGLLHNPAVLYVVADRLAQPQGGWQPFDLGGWRALFYGSDPFRGPTATGTDQIPATYL
jgi:hypothetical protein